MNDLIYKEESYAIVGAAFEAYNELGPGFLEAVYQEAMEWEFKDRGIPFISKPQLLIRFKERTLTSPYEADFLCYQQIVVELKATQESHSKHEAQLILYLKATRMSLGILINFGHYPNLYHKRFIRTKTTGGLAS